MHQTTLPCTSWTRRRYGRRPIPPTCTTKGAHFIFIHFYRAQPVSPGANAPVCRIFILLIVSVFLRTVSIPHLRLKPIALYTPHFPLCPPSPPLTDNIGFPPHAFSIALLCTQSVFVPTTLRMSLLSCVLAMRRTSCVVSKPPTKPSNPFMILFSPSSVIPVNHDNRRWASGCPFSALLHTKPCRLLHEPANTQDAE